MIWLELVWRWRRVVVTPTTPRSPLAARRRAAHTTDGAAAPLRTPSPAHGPDPPRRPLRVVHAMYPLVLSPGYVQRQIRTWGNQYKGGEAIVRDPKAWAAVGLE